MRSTRSLAFMFLAGFASIFLTRINLRTFYTQVFRISGIIFYPFILALILTFADATKANTTVTYHNDQQRTGWNAHETTLTPFNVKSNFGLIVNVPLDDQVDTQPLVVLNQLVIDKGIHNVLYVTTENNTIYAIDANSGIILKARHLGPPVTTPLGCHTNDPNVGINGTPTIDVTTQTMYVIAYLNIGGIPTYKLHALELSTLLDKPGSPIKVSASHKLANGTLFNFNAKYQRQRPALLQVNGNVYAAFGSFCDFSANNSRGWILGWNAATLHSLTGSELTNTLSTQTQYYLSAIWMSGYGLAADTKNGDVFFVTGNSDYHTDTYTHTTNIQESVAKMQGDLSRVVDVFTPSNVFQLDQTDADFGSGGVMVLPDQPGPFPHLAVAAGKDGRLFIMNRDNLGGLGNGVFVLIGACWCGPSYYKGADSVGRVVSSGGKLVKTWKINTAISPILKWEANSPTIASGQDGGFFTSISSNGTIANTAIIWAVGRPVGSDKHVTLYAFDGKASGSSLPQLWSGNAGTWPNTNGNANIVPTVANGKVYVVSNKRLSIFGLRALEFPPAPAIQQNIPAIKSDSVELSNSALISSSTYWGTIKSVNGTQVTIRLRNGRVLFVDISGALKNGTSTVPVVGINVSVIGTLKAKGIFEANMMMRAKEQSSWGSDI